MEERRDLSGIIFWRLTCICIFVPIPLPPIGFYIIVPLGEIEFDYRKNDRGEEY